MFIPPWLKQTVKLHMKPVHQLTVPSVTWPRSLTLFSSVMGHEARDRECQESVLFLPVIYLHDWYESVTDNGIPE